MVFYKSKKWVQCRSTIQAILPAYVATHIAFILMSGLAVFLSVEDFSTHVYPLSTFWTVWNHWDTVSYTLIAQSGYVSPIYTVFFPLYPILIHISAPLFHQNYLIASLFISDVAGFVAFAVLYRLVFEEYGQEVAHRAVLYLAIFPPAFFLGAGYNEGLFLCLSLIAFYAMRHGHWWQAGIWGGLTCLTRSSGLFLLVPLAYEYAKQHQWNLRSIRWDLAALLLLPFALSLYGLYCYWRFGNPFMFASEQSYWGRMTAAPIYSIIAAFYLIFTSGGFITFQAVRNLIDLLPDLFACALVLFSSVGPWRFSPAQRCYTIYALILLFFFHTVPMFDHFPLTSMPRFLIEVFPIFITLALMGKSRLLHFTYLSLSYSLFVFLLIQFLLGHRLL